MRRGPLYLALGLVCRGRCRARVAGAYPVLERRDGNPGQDCYNQQAFERDPDPDDARSDLFRQGYRPSHRAGVHARADARTLRAVARATRCTLTDIRGCPDRPVRRERRNCTVAPRRIGGELV